ncbi:MAG: glycosyltransferase family 4 protein [Nitrososphaerota archaeon]|nr:glycosyltransferase family 4 protein [Nitrososphaerota archaeon]
MSSSGHEIHVFTQSPEKVPVSNVFVHRTRGTHVPGSVVSSLVFKVLTLIKVLQLRLSVVDVQDHTVDGLLLVILNRFLRFPKVVVRGVVRTDTNTRAFFLSSRFIVRTVQRMQGLAATSVTATADACCFESTSTLNTATLPRRVRKYTTYCPVNIELYSQFSASSNHPIRNDSGYLLVVAGLEPRKGLHVLFAGLNELFTKTHLSVLVVGKEKEIGYKRRILAQVNECFTDRVKFLEQVTAEELGRLYSECSIFCSCSLYESFGYPVIEALACGAPVVATKTGVVGDLVLDPPLGVRVEPGSTDDLISAVIDALSMTENPNINKRRRELVMHFSSQHWARRMLKVYAELGV